MLKTLLVGSAAALILSGSVSPALAASIQQSSQEQVSALAELPDDEATLVLPEVVVEDLKWFQKSWSAGMLALEAGQFELAEAHLIHVRNELTSAAQANGGISFGRPGQEIRYLERTEDGLVERTIRNEGGWRTFKTGERLVEEQFDRITSARVHYGNTNHALGISQYQLGKVSQARLSWRRAVAYDKMQYDARMRLGLLELLDGDLRGASRHLRELERFCGSFDCAADTELGRSYQTLTAAIESYQAP